MKPLVITLAVATFAAAAPQGAFAQASFNARPTTPFECQTLASARGPDSIWVGRFSGSRDASHDGPRGDLMGPPQSALQEVCFTSAQECRNWLYNMQSTYTAMVWRADCRRGLLP